MRVLVAEDEIRMAVRIKRGLDEEGYVVDVSFDGRDALRLALEFDYTALVLDVTAARVRRRGDMPDAARTEQVDADTHAHSARCGQ